VNKVIGFEVLTVMVMKRSVCWDITPRSPLNVNWHSKREHSACYRLRADFLLGWVFEE
jgi:hypothetical protein